MSIPSVISGGVYVTAKFGDRYGQHQGVVRNILVKIDLVSPSALTVRLADGEVDTKDGQVWEPMIVNSGPIEAATTLLAEGPDPASYSFDVIRRKLPYQSSATASILDALATHEWQGAKATVYLWCDGLSGFIDAQKVLVGGRISSYRSTPDGASITIKQDTITWNKSIPNTYISIDNAPGAPDGAINRPIPILIGDRRAEGLRFKSPFRGAYTEPGGFNRLQIKDQLGGGTLVDGGLLLDNGRSSGKISVIFAGHPLSVFGDQNSGANIFIRGDDTLAELDLTGVTLTNDATGAKITLDTAALKARIGVIPIDRRYDVNQPADALNAIDLFDTGSFATLDGNEADANKRTVQLLLPSPTALGNYYGLPYMPGGGQAVFMCCAYSTKAGSAGISVFGRANGSNGIVDGVSGTGAATAALDEVKTVTAFYRQDDDNLGQAGDHDDWYSPIERWNFGGGADEYHDTIWLTASIASGAGNLAHIFWLGLIVVYTPKLSVVNPGIRGVAIGGFDLAGRRRRGPITGPGGGARFAAQRPLVGEIKELQSDFYINALGAKDDAGGTYTGTASGAIQRVPDVMHWLLRQYGGVASSDVEVDPAEYGSLIRARSLVTTVEGSPMVVGRQLTENTKLSDVLSGLANEASAYWFINRFTGKHNLIPWDLGASTTYPRALAIDDVLDRRFEAERRPESYIQNSSEVTYGWDGFRDRNLHRVFVAHDRSGSGFADGNLRDQYLTIVTGKNDRLDFQTEEGVKVCTLDPGDYTGIGLAQHVRTKMEAASTAYKFKVEYGFDVVAGYNDKLPVDIAGTDYTITLTPGTYLNGRLFAEHVQAMLASTIAGVVWTVTYDNATLKFTIAASTAFALEWARTTPINDAACAGILGMHYLASTSAATSQAGVFARAAETFFILRKNDTLTILANTGANLNRTAWPTLGYSTLYNRPAENETVVTQRGFAALARRGIRERTAKASKDLHGERTGIPVDSRWITASSVALTRRDVEFDWLVDQPMVIKFATLRMPDVERGMVFPIDASIDGLKPYTRRDTSSSSWAGRRFMVLECRQSTGGNGSGWEQEIVAIEVKKLAVESIGAPITENFDVISVVQTGVPAGPPVSGTIYAQKTTSAGALLWGAGGTRIDHGVTAAYFARCLFMPDGGFIGTWVERETGVGVKIIANRFDSNCSPLWGTTGVVVWSNATTTNGPQHEEDMAIISDGADGCIIGWADSRDGTDRVSVQRLNGTGQEQWTSNGVRVTSGASASGNEEDSFVQLYLLPGAAGFYVVWMKDTQTGGFWGGTPYAQKLSMSGVAAWTAGGKSLGTVQFFFSGLGEPTFADIPVAMLSDGNLAIVNPVSGTATQLRKFDENGDLVWQSANMSTATSGNVELPSIAVAPGDDGSAFVIWSQEDTTPNPDVHNVQVQRVAADGTLLWSVPTIIDASVENQVNAVIGGPCIVKDGSGGIWGIYRSVDTNRPFFVFRLRPDGSLYWPNINLASSTISSSLPRIAVDSSGDAYAQWDYSSPGAVIRRIANDGTMPWSELVLRSGITFGHDVHIDTLAMDFSSPP